LRNGSEKNFDVTLKAEAPVAKSAALSKSAAELFNKLGASFQPLTAAQKSKFHVNSGVLVTQVRAGGIFDDTEIPVGSVITSINKQPINSVDDMDNVITNLKNGRLIITGYYPNGGSFSNVFEIQ
jgi:serine protease Do